MAQVKDIAITKDKIYQGVCHCRGGAILPNRPITSGVDLPLPWLFPDCRPWLGFDLGSGCQL